MSKNLEQIADFYRQAFQFFAAERQIPAIHAGFYNYVGINHTIRVRDGEIFVRISEICREMPLAAQKALAFILVAKLLRKKVPPTAREVYSNFIKTREIREKAAENKKTHGRKIIGSAQGKIYDLEKIFADVNRIYFKDSIAKPTLTWSAKKTFRILGHHDATHETIVVSQSLDDRSVPKYVVEFVVFHEMLHIFHPTEHRNGRRYNHTPQFRRSEKKFQYYEQAEKWIAQNVRILKRRAKKV